MRDPVHDLLKRVRDRALAQKLASKQDLLRDVFEVIERERSNGTPDAIISEEVRGKLVRAQMAKKTASTLATELLGLSKGTLLRDKHRRARRQSKHLYRLVEFVQGLNLEQPQRDLIEIVANEAMKCGLTRQQAYPTARELLGLDALPSRYVRVIQGGRADGNRASSRRPFR